MTKLDQKLTGAIISIVAVMVAGVAFAALAGPPQQVPEPGLFGIIAVGAAAVLLATRLRHKK